jgi:hypothetical protein
MPLQGNGRAINHKENTVLLVLRALPSNDRCLQSHRLALSLYATIFFPSAKHMSLFTLPFNENDFLLVTC